MIVLPFAFLLLPRSEAAAQSVGHGPVGIRAQATPLPASAPSFQEAGERPRWVKWGLIGAAAGAATFALLGSSSVDPNPVAQDAAVGAVIGFAILGGAIAFYDWVCKPESSSNRAGLC